MQHRTGPVELVLEQLPAHAKAHASALHDRAAGRGLTAHEQRYPDDAFVAGTTAISAEAPSSITYSSDTMEVVEKYTWVMAMPDSYNTSPSGMSTGSSAGS